MSTATPEAMSHEGTVAAFTSPPLGESHRIAALPPPLVIPTPPSLASTHQHDDATVVALTPMPHNHSHVRASNVSNEFGANNGDGGGDGCPFLAMQAKNGLATSAPASSHSSSIPPFGSLNPSIGLPIPHDILTSKKLATILRMLPDALLCVRPDGIIVDCNEKTLSMFGYTRQELIGKSCNCLLPEHLRAGHNEQMRSAFMLNEIREMGRRRSVVGQHHDGEQLELSIHLSPFRLVTFEEEQMLAETSPSAEEARQHIGQSLMLTVVRDITERTRMALSRQRAMQRQKLMDEFLRLINHETRTSLHAIHHSLADLHTEIETVCSTMHSQVEQLRQEWIVASTPTASVNSGSASSPFSMSSPTPSPPIFSPVLSSSLFLHTPEGSTIPDPLRQRLDTVQSTTERMGLILSNMIDYQNLQSGNIVAQMTTFQVTSLLQTLIENHQKRAASLGIRLQIYIPEEIPAVRGNAELLVKCLGALVDNAVKASRAGQRVVVRCTSMKNAPVIEPASKLGRQTSRDIAEGMKEMKLSAGGGLTPRRLSPAMSTSSLVISATNETNETNSPDLVGLGTRFRRIPAVPTFTRGSSGSPHLKPIDRILARTASRSPSRTLARSRADSPSLTSITADGSLPIHLCFQVMDNGTGFAGVPHERLTPFRPSRFMASDALRNTPSPAEGKSITDSENETEVLNANADVSTTRSTGNGLGLGIPIARLGTRSLKGTFEITSKPQQQQHHHYHHQDSHSTALHSSISFPSPESNGIDRTFTSMSSSTQDGCTCASSSASSTSSSSSPAVHTDLCPSCLNVQSAFTTVCQLILPFSYIPPSQPQQQLLDASAQSKIVEWITSPQLASTRKSFHILIVEDNAINCKILVHLLKKRGFTSVTTAADGELALKVVDARAVKVREENMKRKERNDVVGEEKESYEKEEFSCILMDCEMPVMDGFTCTRELRARYAAASSSAASSSSIPPPIPIVALTANATYACQRQCFDAGMDVFLTKPLHADSLFFTLAALPPFAQYPLALSPFFLNSQRPIGGGGK